GSWTTYTAGLAEVETTVISVDPANPLNLYLGSRGDGLFKSTDGGVSWSASSAGADFDTVLTLVIDPVTPATVYVGSQSSGVHKSGDGGASWSEASSGLPFEAVPALAIDPGTPATLFAANFGDIFRTTNGATTWAAVGAGVPAADITALVVDPTSSSNAFAGAGSGVLATTDGGASWSERNSGLRALNIDRLQIEPASPATVYAASPDAGIFRSDDSGASWQGAHTGDDRRARALALATSQPGTLFAAGVSGLRKTTDGGASWSDPVVDPADFGGLGPQVRALAVDPNAPGVVFAGQSGAPGKVYRSTDGGASWSPSLEVMTTLRTFEPQSISFAPGSSSVALVGYFGQPLGFGPPAYTVERTTDGGATWASVLTGDALDKLEIRFDPLDPTTVFVTVSDDSAFEIFRSTDSGATWQPLAAALPCAHLVLPDPGIAAALWAGCEPVFLSEDHGASWAAFDDTGFPVGAGGARDLALALTSSPTLHACTFMGVFSYSFSPQADLSISKDDGLTEVQVGDPLTYTLIAENSGPQDALGSTVEDVLPADVSCSWTCGGANGGGCTAGPVAGDINDTVDLPVGGSVTYTVDCIVNATAADLLVNAASVAPPPDVLDPDSTDDSASDSDVIVQIGGCGVAEDRALSGITVTTMQTFEACNSISAGPDFIIQIGGQVLFRAGSEVLLTDGFAVQDGTLEARIETPMP
ncbi:MAG: YCF48-related protein, partial [Thermoanaerobaculia bacterium]